MTVKLISTASTSSGLVAVPILKAAMRVSLVVSMFCVQFVRMMARIILTCRGKGIVLSLEVVCTAVVKPVSREASMNSLIGLQAAFAAAWCVWLMRCQ